MGSTSTRSLTRTRTETRESEDKTTIKEEETETETKTSVWSTIYGFVQASFLTIASSEFFKIFLRWGFKKVDKKMPKAK